MPRTKKPRKQRLSKEARKTITARKKEIKQLSKRAEKKTAISLYNTLTRKKEIFKPIKKGKVGIYSCGPTVYSYQHIGNLRTYLFSDILKRILLYNGYEVRHVMNVTDVGHLTSDADEGEDKMEKSAKKEGKKAADIANYYLAIFRQDFDKLGIIEPNIWCKATEHIYEQIELIKKLEKKGYTYKTSDGMYFDTSKFKNYGKLARLKKEGLEAGKRIALKEKRNITDFALWKFSEKPGARQQEWQSPWGTGFPGWHIECSAMSMRYLGEHFDIHTGGEDHIPIHHTNEIAQSEAATGKKFVNYWLHGSFLTSKGEKVSKSTGGLYTISELEGMGFKPLDYRYFCLTAHYRSQLDFSLENLESAKNSYQGIKNKVHEIKKNLEITGIRSEKVQEHKAAFLKTINDDLDMPKALALLHNMLKTDDLKNSEKYALILDFDKVLGLELDKEEKVVVPEEIKKLVEKREQARKTGNFALADKMREEIRAKGYWVDDTERGPEIKKLKK